MSPCICFQCEDGAALFREDCPEHGPEVRRILAALPMNRPRYRAVPETLGDGTELVTIRQHWEHQN